MNPYLDTSKIKNTSKVLANGLVKVQIIHLWTGKEPFETDFHYLAPSECETPLEESTHVADIINLMHGRSSDGIKDPVVGAFYGSLAGFEMRTPTETYRYLRPHLAHEAQPQQGGAPLSEHRVDYSVVDWNKPNATLARELGVTRQTIALQRKRHAPQD